MIVERLRDVARAATEIGGEPLAADLLGKAVEQMAIEGLPRQLSVEVLD